MQTARPTWGWTEAHSSVAVAAVIAFAGSATALIEGGNQAAIVVAAFVIAFLFALTWDSYAGLLVGLGTAALLIFVRQLTGAWTPASFLPAALETAALIATGWSAGRAGRLLRDAGAARAAPANDSGGVFGSLGMLPADLALVRLEEETARAATYRRPLSLMLLDVRVVGGDLDASGAEEAFRAAARVTETTLRELDVPFQFEPHRIGAIFPETDLNTATIASGRILEALVSAHFTDRASGRRRPLGEAVAARMAVVTLGPQLATASELLDGAIAALQRSAPQA
jgi:hypothetical protein